MSFESLQERLEALQHTTSQLRELIDRLATIEFPLDSVPRTVEEEGSASGDLGLEIGQLLRGGLDEQELLQEEVKYIRPEGRGKDDLRDGVERMGQELVSCRYAFRKSRIAAKKSLERAQRAEREQAMLSYSAPVSGTVSPAADGTEQEHAPEPPRVSTRPHKPYHHQQAQQKSSLSDEDQQTVGASSNVTNALRRTHELIAAELARSEFAHETLTESSAALKQLNESYGSLDSMLASSRDLLGTLLRSQKSDTWYLQTAMYMLLGTAAWLVFRRILYGPLWWLLWLPLRVVFGVGSKAGSAVMQGRGDSAGGPAGSGRHGAAENDAEANVEGLPNKDLPTAKVGLEGEGEEPSAEEDPDSMVGKVGKIVEGNDEAAHTLKDEL